MADESKKYSNFLIIFAVIFVVFYGAVAAFNYAIDPLGMNDFKFNGIDFGGVTYPGSDRMDVVARYAREPKAGIMLGDSRVKYHLYTDDIKKVTGEEYFNFGLSGGTVTEMIDQFWFAAKEGSLKDAYFFISLSSFGGRYQTNRVESAVRLIKNKPAYYTSLFSTKNSLKVLNRYRLTKKVDLKKVHDEQMKTKLANKDKDWPGILRGYTNDYYNVFDYPETVVRELEKIKKYCDENNIRLVFVIPPSHIDVLNKIKVYNLEKDNERFKRDLARITTTIDYAFPNEWTTDRYCYNDPVHFNEEISMKMADEIWGGNLKVGKLLSGGVDDLRRAVKHDEAGEGE